MNTTGIMLRKHLRRPGLVLVCIGMLSVTLILPACASGYYGHWSPAWSPDGTKITFSSNRDGNWDIYVMNSDGSKWTKLTKNTALRAVLQAVLRAGIRAGLPSGWQLQDSNGGANPAWSPDSSKIAFSSDRDGNWDIYVMDNDGSNQTNLTGNPTDDDAPAWSPDGTKITFSSNRDGNWDIYVMNSDGSNQTNLTGNPADDDAPAWSPDGTKIAFSSDRSGHGEIYVMNADGSNQMKLTSSEHAANYPAWSPDGSKIAFGRATHSWLWHDIYLVNADGTDLRNITPDRVGSEEPIKGLTWSPDGTKIAFAGYRPGWNEMHVEIYVMDSDGSNQTRLTLKPGVDSILSLLPWRVVLLLGFLLMVCLPIVVLLIVQLRKRHRRAVSSETLLDDKNK